MTIIVGQMWDTFTDGILDYALSAYVTLEPWVIPFILVGIIGYIYAFSGSVIVAVAGILITFGLYGGTSGLNVFADTPQITIFLYLIALIGTALLITTLFIKRGR